MRKFQVVDLEKVTDFGFWKCCGKWKTFRNEFRRVIQQQQTTTTTTTNNNNKQQ